MSPNEHPVDQTTPNSEVPAADTTEFEQFVAALLQVDPEGLSGKHHKPPASDDAKK